MIILSKFLVELSVTLSSNPSISGRTNVAFHLAFLICLSGRICNLSFALFLFISIFDSPAVFRAFFLCIVLFLSNNCEQLSTCNCTLLQRLIHIVQLINGHFVKSIFLYHEWIISNWSLSCCPKNEGRHDPRSWSS